MSERLSITPLGPYIGAQVYAGGGGADCRNARFRIYGSVSG